MPRVPYNPTQVVAPRQNQPRINNSGSIAAIGNESAAKSQMIQSFQGAINTGMDLRQDKIERDTFADAQRFESVASQAEMNMNQKLDAIQVADGVDFQAESEAIREEYITTLQDWVESPGNVRHKQKKSNFTSQVNGIKEQAKLMMLERGDQYQKQVNIGAGKRGIETGIMANDPDAIERGVMTMHLEKVRGYVSADEAGMMYEKHVTSAKKLADQRTMTVAENLLAQGDSKGFREAVDSMELPTIEEKKKIKREKASTYAYNSARVALDELENLQDLTEFAKDPEKLGGYKGLTANHKTTLKVMANGKIRRIERAQKRNAQSFLSDAARGKFDPESFNERAVFDTEEGLPQGQLEELQQDIQKSLEAYEKGESFKVLEKEAMKDDDYVELLNKLSAATFRPETLDLDKTLKDIRRLKVGDPIKADRLSQAFGIAAEKQRTQPDEDESWFAAFMRRGFYESKSDREKAEASKPSQAELDSFEAVYTQFQKSVEVLGAWNGLNDEVKRVQKDVIRLHETNPDMTIQEQIEKLKIIMEPIKEKIMEREKYGTTMDR